jgi:hypothetical protein
LPAAGQRAEGPPHGYDDDESQGADEEEGRRLPEAALEPWVGTYGLGARARRDLHGPMPHPGLFIMRAAARARAGASHERAREASQQPLTGTNARASVSGLANPSLPAR